MNTTHVTLGDRGRLVIPAEMRNRQRWRAGTPLVFVDTADGVVLMSREQARERIRQQLEGKELVEELLSERRLEAERDDQAA
ncbi:AbrB/MazE/SpoVT family DNA-binding domain-containing protein [Garicola koreensis]|uniref:AbrB family looped-hinge helix DNA binding protein n=1 Tax=Garicola koreensis TaxID=1262554 RepID=A0A7W5XZB3_9MICC|nr:AbrB/MazE/SpoVT family DNA-binding domain-containing protein [Garicola koreensis]MBB3667326.1 AbrB family looped-hinge helix DNA binding protein [Garicola koreensis]